MRRTVVLIITLQLVLCGSVNYAAAQSAKTIAFTNGAWFTGSSFESKTGYYVRGIVTFRRPSHLDETIDLRGRYVIPPFGEAHNHNVETLNKVEALVARYLQHGIFYVKIAFPKRSIFI